MSDRYEPSGEYPEQVSVSREEALEYLQDLQESGETNMLGAGTYLESHFDISRNESKQIVMWWIQG